jgi:peptide subunit release factor 1 (eRF1)
MRDNINNILETIIDDLKDNEDKKEYNYVEDIIEKAPRNSVTGMQDTIKLVQDGRSEILVVPNYKTYSGWKCDGCLYVARNQHQPGCIECNGNARETDLIEELIRLNFRNRGKIEIVKNHAAKELEKYEGIGALIRY